MKKLFISADLEGVSGVSSWEETRYGGPGYDAACRQLTREVAAACRAAQERDIRYWSKTVMKMPAISIQQVFPGAFCCIAAGRMNRLR